MKSITHNHHKINLDLSASAGLFVTAAAATVAAVAYGMKLHAIPKKNSKSKWKFFVSSIFPMMNRVKNQRRHPFHVTKSHNRRRHCHHHDDENEMIPRVERNKSAGKIQWSTVLALYVLLQLKPRQASVVFPLMYWFFSERNGEESADHDGNTGNSSSNGYSSRSRSSSSDDDDDDDDDIQVTTDAAARAAHTTAIHEMVASSMGERMPERIPSVVTSRRQRYVELLVHNVSHTDLVLCLGIPRALQQLYKRLQAHACNDVHDDNYGEKLKLQEQISQQHQTELLKVQNGHETEKILREEAHALCRPRFSAFDMFCQRILSVLEVFHNGTGTAAADAATAEGNSHSSYSPSSSLLQQHLQQQQQHLYSSIMSFPKYERSDSSARFSLVTPRPSRRTMLPVGFNLSQLAQDYLKNIPFGEGRDLKREKLDLDSDDLLSLRVRGRDMAKLEDVMGSNGYYWPRPMALSSPSRRHVPNDTEQVETDQAPENGTNKSDNRLHLDAVFFPLLSSLLRRWHKQMLEKYGPVKMNHVKKVLILVSGVGTPRNWTHSKTGNSTEACAKLMEIFIKVLYPDVVVVKLHSQREIFRYDENIAFANKELLPCIDAYRDAHALGEPYPDEVGRGTYKKGSSSKSFDTDWKQTFALTLSFADGAPARTHAIQSSLRPYRPTYFHFWQLKTFWHDSKICDDDIEVHSFESMETVPAMEVGKTNPDVKRVVDEMKRFRHDFLATICESDNDIQKFWLRKTKKPVLAVLLVNVPGKGLTVYRGTNMEVSMPTGSLCAERNVIGTALATNPALRREDLMMVAVLAVPLPKDFAPADTPPQISSPPSLSNSNTSTGIYHNSNDGLVKGTTLFFSEVEKKLRKYQRPENCRRSMSIGSFASIVEDGESNESNDSSWENMSGNDVNSVPDSPPGISKHDAKSAPLLYEVAYAPSIVDSEASTPIRKIKLYGDGDNNDNIQKTIKSRKNRRKGRSVVIHSSEDINPLKPCGACNEWLKKIAESNPYFKVITFTDTDCNGVYVTPCQE